MGNYLGFGAYEPCSRAATTDAPTAAAQPAAPMAERPTVEQPAPERPPVGAPVGAITMPPAASVVAAPERAPDAPLPLAFRTRRRPARGTGTIINFPSLQSGLEIADFDDYPQMSSTLRQVVAKYGGMVYVRVGQQVYSVELPCNVDVYELLGPGDMYDGIVVVEPNVGTAYIASAPPSTALVTVLSLFVASLAAPRIRSVPVARAFVIKAHGESTMINRCVIEPTYVD